MQFQILTVIAFVFTALFAKALPVQRPEDVSVRSAEVNNIDHSFPPSLIIS
ncbi:hypothetical protein B0H13DRAFT_2326392 [Mycena leptocephala]|nr:hypothetical protein B0H13DRAFT_2326392 [Mycena leptocephala]